MAGGPRTPLSPVTAAGGTAPSPAPAKAPTPTVIALVLALLAALVGWYLSREQARASGLRADSVVAVNDSTRVIQIGDSTVMARRILQLTLLKDSLDKLLAVQSAVRIVTVTKIDSLRIHDTVPVVDSAGVRSATFAVDTTPYHGTAAVKLPAPPAVGSLDLRLVLDPLPLTVRVGCGPEVNGVKPATAFVSGPRWAKLGIDQVNASPDVCNPIAAFTLPHSVPWWFAPVGVVAGYILGRVF